MVYSCFATTIELRILILTIIYKELYILTSNGTFSKDARGMDEPGKIEVVHITLFFPRGLKKETLRVFILFHATRRFMVV